MGTDNKTEAFLKMNPLGKVPTLSGPEGALWESNAIARYIARLGSDAEGLLGKGAFEQSLVDQWIEFTNSYVTSNMFSLFVFLIGYGPFDKTKFENSLKAVEQALTWLEKHFSQVSHKFLVNNRITLADVILGCTFSMSFKLALGPEVRNKFPKAMAYFEAVYASDNFKAVSGEQTWAASLPAQWTESQAN